VDFSKSAAPVVTKLTEIGGKAVDHVTLEAPLLAALAPGQRRRQHPAGRHSQGDGRRGPLD
jgi:hypothetical protein